MFKPSRYQVRQKAKDHITSSKTCYYHVPKYNALRRTNQHGVFFPVLHNLNLIVRKCQTWECKLVQPLRKTVWRFLKKPKIELPYDPAIALLGIYPRDSGVLFRRDTCTPMFIAALSTIAKVWKEPKCPSMMSG